LNLTRIKRAVICDLICSTRYLIVKDRCVSLSKRLPSGRKWNLVISFRLVNNFFNFFFEVLVANRSKYLRKNKSLGVAVGLPRATKEVLG